MKKSTSLTLSERARLEQVEGIVFNLQRYSLHDGPGLRTNIFLKGCPLRCAWCANPESQRLQPELALSASLCIPCGQFCESCPEGWGKTVSADRTESYGQRAALCPTGAIHWLGERRTAGELIREVLRDVPFYEAGGGLTLTGGEPTQQPHLAEALLRLAQAEGISTAMESCGQTHWAILARLAPHLDHILFDLKHPDDKTHRALTGAGNRLILSNLRRLVALHPSVTIRVPLIPGFNASAETMRAIAEWVLSLERPVKGVELLPYHSLGKGKYQALGRAYPWEGYERLTPAEIKSLAEVIAAYDITVSVGGS